MAGYSPLKIVGNSTGLVQDREEFILPDDAYPVLQNAYVWRERILRKKGYQLLGRLQRKVTIPPASNTNNLLTGLEPTATLVPGSLNIIGSLGTVWTDPAGDGVLVPSIAIPNGTVNYVTGDITGPAPPNTGFFEYYPGLPVMGIRSRELTTLANDETVVFDQKYAYIFDTTLDAFKEFIPGTTWNANGNPVSAIDFFWSTNYWVSSTTLPGTATPFFTTTNRKLFWVTNNTGKYATKDPIRITDGTTWVDFSPPNFGQIDTTNFLLQCLSFLPFRGRMVCFNTWEGPGYGSALQYPNRIRWCTIGNPFIPYSAGPPAKGSWRDDIRGQGGFLDIPTSEDIVAVGFVRDNLVIYCTHSTWQLRYTGRSIAPFQIEKVNSELGSESPFSAVQFDTSLVGIGDKGVVECDSYQSNRIDIKIPDFVFKFQSTNNGTYRIQGVRDFENRLAFWTVCVASAYDGKVQTSSRIFPNQRLVYNYENDSWALFDDSLTAIGTYQPQNSRTWLNTKVPWVQCKFAWVDQPAGVPVIIAGNQQGFVELLDELTVNDVSLYISNIVGSATQAVVVTSPNHNLRTGMVIGIQGILGTPYATLNDGIYGIITGDNANADPANKFRLMEYSASDNQFSIPKILTSANPYIGGGLINIRENFSIKSKKFNFLDDGQSIQMGFVDILMDSSGSGIDGAITLNVYLDYNDSEPSNTYPRNQINGYSPPNDPDTFFNSIVPTTSSSLNNIGGTKFWQRVFCATRANFLTLEYTFSNFQLAGPQQQRDVQIDAQVLWLRKAGRLSQI